MKKLFLLSMLSFSFSVHGSAELKKSDDSSSQSRVVIHVTPRTAHLLPSNAASSCLVRAVNVSPESFQTKGTSLSRSTSPQGMLDRAESTEPGAPLPSLTQEEILLKQLQESLEKRSKRLKESLREVEQKNQEMQEQQVVQEAEWNAAPRAQTVLGNSNYDPYRAAVLSNFINKVSACVSSK